MCIEPAPNYVQDYYPQKACISFNWPERGGIPRIAVSHHAIADIAEGDKGVVSEKPEQAPAMVDGDYRGQAYNYEGDTTGEVCSCQGVNRDSRKTFDNEKRRYR